ncbi:MAG: DUF6538 domain-containing protein [Desulfobulbia bacterium]
MKFPYLYRKGEGGIFQFRRRVPKEIREPYGKTEVNLSLRTSDEAEAKQLYHHQAAKIETEFDRLRNNTDEKECPTPAFQSAKERYDEILNEDFDYRIRVFEEAKADELAFWTGDIIPLPNDPFMDFLMEEAIAIESALVHCFRTRIEEKRKKSLSMH